MRQHCFGRTAILAMVFLTALPCISRAQDRGEGPLDPAQPKGITPQEIITRFAAKEKQFKQARERYTYRQDIKVQTLDGSTVTGEFRLVEDIVFDSKGRRMQQVQFAPQSTLTEISLSREDMDDFEHRMGFLLTSDDLPEYDVLYVGQQKQDELHTYVFDVAPKVIEKNKRYFQGRLWVDDQDFQIVKCEGKTVPDIRTKKNENIFPKFTTWREQVDGQYWFPIYTRTDDTLHFSGNDVRIRQIIKYSDYKRFGTSVKITYEGEQVEKSGEGQSEPKTTK